jgi:predicted CXXCH cytochrome family protein
VLTALLAAPAARGQGITGSAHDFSAAGWSGGEICVVCHTPHNADPTATPFYGPLWNHELTTAVFTVYSSPTMYVTASQPTGPSKLCLSCHDGTVAVDSFGGNTGTTFIAGPGLVGTDLSNDHPISIDWEHQTGQNSCSECHAPHNPSLFISQLPFFDGRVECASCHDVHNSSGIAKLLHIPITGSELCLYCHGV